MKTGGERGILKALVIACVTEMRLVGCAVYARARKTGIIIPYCALPTLLTCDFKIFLKHFLKQVLYERESA